MKLRNNTGMKIVLYFGNANKEDPTADVTIDIGQFIDLDKYPKEDISIQEK